jgi:hypothetical protein
VSDLAQQEYKIASGSVSPSHFDEKPIFWQCPAFPNTPFLPQLGEKSQSFFVRRSGAVKDRPIRKRITVFSTIRMR